MKKIKKRQSRELKKAKVAICQAIIILIIFIVGTILAFNYHYNPSFGSLSSAVEHYSKGGEIDQIYELEKGSFVFIKKSKAREYGYFYEDNNEWKYNQFIKEKTYQLADGLELSIIQIDGVERSLIKVESKNEIKSISDNLGTDYKKIELAKKNNIYFGENIRKISKYYTIYINNKEYKVTNKKYMDSLFQ